MQKEKIYFANLDSLRTIAFLFVFTEHIWWRAFVHTDIKDFPFFYHLTYAVLANGFLGVSVFFTISGFLITFLILSEINKKGKLDIWSFYMRRTLRIWPLYFCFVIFVFIVFPYLQQIAGISYLNPANPLRYFTFLSNFDVITLHNNGFESHLLSGITWSLSIEEQFYLIWPLFFLFIPKRFFSIVFITLIVACVFFRFLHHSELVFIYFHTLAVCGDLAIGGLAAFLVLKYASFRNFFETLGTKQRILIYSAGIIYVLLKDHYLMHQYAYVYNRLLSTIFFAFVILDQNYNLSSAMKLGKIKILNNWGKYTYGLYLLHPIGLWMITLFVDYFDIYIDSFSAKSIVALFALIATCMAAYISYHYLEKPFLNMKKRFSHITT